MAWDASRPVPWKRLIIEYAVIGVGIAVVSLAFFDGERSANYLTIVLAAPVYIGFGAVLAKFGYARKSLAQVRTEAAAAQRQKAAGASTTTSARPKPAPTRRTSTGPSKKKR